MLLTMGGGNDNPVEASEEHQEVIARIYQFCDIASYACPSYGVGSICEEYKEVERVLSSLSRPPHVNRVIAQCALHVDTIQKFKSASRRYQKVEESTRELVEKAIVLADGTRELVGGGGLVAALKANAPGIRAGLQFLAAKMGALGTMVEAISAVHRAVGHDMDSLVASTAGVVEDPRKADIGLAAAPLIAGTAASTIGLALMRAGPLGMLGAAALFGVGALGASEITHSQVLPLIRQAFCKLYDETSAVSSLIDSRASHLAMLGVALTANSILLSSALEIRPDGSDLSAELFGEKAATLSVSIEALHLRCMAARHRTSAFLVVSTGLSANKNPPRG